MSQFKSEFFNLMVERGFTINAPTKQALTPICMSAKKRKTCGRLSGLRPDRRQSARRPHRSLDDDALVPEMRSQTVDAGRRRYGPYRRPVRQRQAAPLLDEATLQHNIEGLKNLSANS